MSARSHLCVRAYEFRAAADVSTDDGRTLTGYAATFNDPTEIDSWEGWFNETIASSAFDKTLRENPRVVMQFDHGRDTRVGTCPIGAYTDLTPDRKGLKVTGRLFDNPVVEPVRQAVEAQAINGMSFRFRVTRDEWTDKDGNAIPAGELDQYLWGSKRSKGPLNRTIKEVQLFEAGPVVFPAYSTTSVGVRSGEPRDLKPEDREALVAEYMRTAEGWSQESAPESAPEVAPAAAPTVERSPEADVPAQTSGAESATLPTEASTEDAARSGTSSESTKIKRVIPAMPRRIPDMP